MKNKTGILLMTAGTAMIIAALVLFLYNYRESRLAGQASRDVILQLRDEIPVNAAEDLSMSQLDGENAGEREAPALPVDGYEYMGILSVPSLGLDLPVMDRWDYKRLKIAPCRHFGSAENNDLVIAGHNYDTHFGRLHNLRIGEVISFLSADGIQITYTVESVEILDPDDVSRVYDSPWDLVLYTCTVGGRNRVAVGCMRLPVKAGS